MTDEDDGAALPTALTKHVGALALEALIAHCQHLVDQQDVGLGLYRDGEGESHEHARREVAQLHVHETVELGKLDDRGQIARDLAA